MWSIKLIYEDNIELYNNVIGIYYSTSIYIMQFYFILLKIYVIHTQKNLSLKLVYVDISGLWSFNLM